MQNRNRRIDTMNGIGILFVVLGHYGSYITTNDWTEWIWSWHMPLFFVTSGYLFSMKEDKYLRNGLFQFFMHNIKTVLLPYCLFAMLYWCVHLFEGGATISSSAELFILLKALLLGGGYLENVFLPLWFLQLFFIVKMLYWMIIHVRAKNRFVYHLIAIIILVGTVPFQSVVTGRPPYHINALPAGIVFMMMGDLLNEFEKNSTIISLLEKEFLSGIEVKELLASVLLVLGSIVACDSPGNVAHITTLWYFVGAAATILAVYIISDFIHLGLLELWGQYSLIILGFHGITGAISRQLFEYRLLKNWNGFLKNFVLVGIQMLMLTALIVVWHYSRKWFDERLKHYIMH